MQRRIDSLDLNPMGAATARELEAARTRYARLELEAGNGKLLALLDKERRSELAYFEASKKARTVDELLHEVTLGEYTHRAKRGTANVSTLELYRRVEHHLRFLDSLVQAGTQPEVVYDGVRIQASVGELSSLIGGINSSEMRSHAAATLERIRTLSRDENLQADCSLALIAVKTHASSVRADGNSGIAAAPRGIVATPRQTLNLSK